MRVSLVRTAGLICGVLPLFLFFCAFLIPPVVAQGPVVRDQVDPNWLPDGHSFWYRVLAAPGSNEFVLIDAETGERKSAPDLPSLGLPESPPLRSSGTVIQPRSSKRTGVSSGIRFVNELDENLEVFWIDPGGKQVSYGKVSPKSERVQQTYEGHVWLVIRPDGRELAVIEAGPLISTLIIDGEGRQPGKKAVSSPDQSPDRRWSARVEKDRVVLTARDGEKERLLRAPIPDKAGYRGRVSWSPDSKAFVVSAAVEVPERRVTIVESSPPDQGQPRLKTFPYAKPGDPLPKPQLVLFRTESEEGRVIDPTLFPEPFTQSHEIRVTWSPDGSEV
ncbi:MAG: DPP IV N-terminal domain-containing protein, partial [Verrucomicrobiae bacterium]|nr:DPP IV N-terminal domain-containing protein [Verrucomicrobiae bacterium]